MSMILEEQYNVERAKPPKHASGTISTRHRPTTATEPTHGIDPNNVEQNLTTATKPTVILKYQTRIETEMTQIETRFFKNPLDREWILKRNRRIFVETNSVLKRRRNDDGGTTHPRHYNTLRQKLQPPKQTETTAVGRVAINPRKEICGGSNGTRMVRSKNPSHHHLPELHGGKGFQI